MRSCLSSGITGIESAGHMFTAASCLRQLKLGLLATSACLPDAEVGEGVTG
jgi:hypothetical protein